MLLHNSTITTMSSTTSTTSQMSQVKGLEELLNLATPEFLTEQFAWVDFRLEELFYSYATTEENADDFKLANMIYQEEARDNNQLYEPNSESTPDTDDEYYEMVFNQDTINGYLEESFDDYLERERCNATPSPTLLTQGAIDILFEGYVHI